MQVVGGRIAIAALIIGATGIGTMIAACGGSDDASNGAGADATADVMPQDVFTPDDASDGSLVCAPMLPSGWKSPPFVPPVLTNTACTPTQVQGMYDSCFGDSHTTTTCNSFKGAPATAACAACMETSYAASAYGAVIVLSNGSWTPNLAGCMAIKDGQFSDTSCAARYQASIDCDDTACTKNCPIDRTSSATVATTYAAYNACEEKAIDSACASYTATTCYQDSIYDDCFPAANTFELDVLAAGNAICASGVVDAGNDAADAADAAADSSDDSGD